LLERQVQLFRAVFVMTRLSIAFTEAHGCKYDIVLEYNKRECEKLLLDLVIEQQKIFHYCNTN